MANKIVVSLPLCTAAAPPPPGAHPRFIFSVEHAVCKNPYRQRSLQRK